MHAQLLHPATQANPSQLASSQHYITDAVMHACGLEESSGTHSRFVRFTRNARGNVAYNLGVAETNLVLRIA